MGTGRRGCKPDICPSWIYGRKKKLEDEKIPNINGNN
jgi:hypothetical protein